ncbi:hypothetical protein GCM10016455_28460 [Aliiroseovarius zhejiangensis]|uniref:Uncharacterized protein n=1 Tax=Aliiroseovarius zhejiangensis TaxID=1632025 RepID=A0ABQ3J6Z2_9RHOB|nr:hypothetical protein GCM10016455_28460 [Aliiroseovarius zhejiangensis]
MQPEGGSHNTPSATFTLRYDAVDHPVVATNCHSRRASAKTAMRDKATVGFVEANGGKTTILRVPLHECD